MLRAGRGGPGRPGDSGHEGRRGSGMTESRRMNKSELHAHFAEGDVPDGVGIELS